MSATILAAIGMVPGLVIMEADKLQNTIGEGKRISFNLGFFIGVLGAVMTATLIYAKFTGQQEALQSQVTYLEKQNEHHSQQLRDMEMNFRLFVQKYDQDMNRYVRDRKDSNR